MNMIMRKINVWAVALFSGFLGFTSCSENSNQNAPGTTIIPETVYQAFQTKYPGAQQVSWQTKGAYAVASFYLDLADVKAAQSTSRSAAWFSLTGAEWDMSTFEIPFTMLPDTVQRAFLSGPYGTWSYDREADLLCRPGVDTLYVIEAEQQSGTVETSVDLYYTRDAVLVKEIIDADVDDDYAGMLPQKPASTVTGWLQENYPDARIIDIELEDGGTEVEFVFNGNKMEACFTAASQWLYTKTEYTRRDFSIIPPKVLAALKTTEHYVSLDQVDDIAYYQTAASGNYYTFELETRYDDVTVFISESGELIAKPIPGGSENQTTVSDDVQKQIDTRYPQAVVLEKEYDDGYLEVTIRHEGLLKELYFNGRGEWVRTEWEVTYDQVPGAVVGYLASAYAGCRIDRDEVEVRETPEALWYEFEVERSGRELQVQVYADGTLKSERND